MTKPIRNKVRGSVAALLIAGLALATVLGCTTASPSSEQIGTSPMAGIEMVYRFPTGRTYRARYTEETVAFVLLSPEQDPAPSATLPYRWRRVGDDIALIVWDSADYGSTFVVDHKARTLYVSAPRKSEPSFIGTAKILEWRRVRE